MDADDAYVPSRLQMLVQVGNAYAADIVADNLALYDMEAEKTVSDGVLSLRQLSIISQYEYVRRSRGDREDIDWGLLHPIFRSEFIKRRGLQYPLNLRHGEDFAFVLSALLEGAKFVFTPDVGYVYTQRLGTLSNRLSPLSRTQVDFKTMAAHTLSLMRNPRVRSDRTMLSLLRTRYRALRTIDVQYRMPGYLKERELLKAVELLAYDLRSWRILIAFIRGKALSLLGLS